MAKNKIIYGDETLIDLTNDTVSPNNLLLGETAHDRSGESIQGNVVVPTVNDSEITIQKNGVDVDSFTLNQSTDKTINITMSKSDVGLDNVPNVSTDDQTPTFTEAPTRTNIASGEKLSVILGKIKKFFTDLKTVAFTGSYNDLTDQPTITDEKVKQTPTAGENKGYRILASGADSDTEETNIAHKMVGFTLNPSNGILQLFRKHTETTSQPSILHLGNNVANGSNNATHGVLRIFGRKTYYGQFYDKNNILTDNRLYEIPDKNGVLALTNDIPTNISAFTNDSGFITSTVNNLTNYYLKTETYNKTEVDDLISQLATLQIEVVQTLPTHDISTSTIYLVPKQTAGAQDVYDEYIYINDAWELIGDTEVDLSNYYTKTETEGKIDDKINALDVTGSSNINASKTIKSWSESDGKVSITTQDIQITESQVTNLTTDLGNKVDKETGKGLSTNDYTTAEKNKLEGIAEGAEANVQSDWNQTTTTADDYIKNKPSTMPPSSHTHGNITNGGALQTTDITIASGDKLVVTDASNSNKVARTSVAFDGSTTNTALTPKGTFESFAKANDITTAIQALDGTISGSPSASKTLTAFSETDGKVSATFGNIAISESQVTNLTTDLGNKVDKVSGKGLSTNDYTTTEKDKLAGIAEGAEVNVQPDWNQTTTTADDYIKNKPTIPTVNNATLTIQKNGTNVQTFTANASSNKTANIIVPTKTSDLTNDSNFVTSTDLDNKVSKSGDTMSGNLKFSAGKSITTTDKAGKEYYPIRENGSNLWIGASEGAGVHHAGSTYISTGVTYNSSEDGVGNTTAYLSIPTYTKSTNTWSQTAKRIAYHNANPTSGRVMVSDGTAGGIKSSDYTIAKSVPSDAVFTDTTYTISGGTNKITVTPSSGSAYDVTVTPSISNNITGSGTRTSGYLAKFSGTNTITNGPQIGSDTTKYLRNDGTWDTPSGSVTGVKGSYETDYRSGNVNLTPANIGAVALTTYEGLGTASIGANRWVDVATLTVTQTYADFPIMFEVSGRGINFTRVIVRFASANGTDPALSSFTSDNSLYFYIKKTATSTWKVYYYSPVSYGTLALHRISGLGANNKITVTVNMTVLTEEPTDLTQAVRGGSADYATNAGTATKLGSSNVGTATKPIYLASGTATACTYELNKTVPADAVFTDTKNTAGSTDSSSKLFLIGATSQAANPQTYSHDTAYVGTDGCLYSGGTKVLTAHQDISGKVNKSGDTITGTLILSRTTDASGTANNKPALIVGGTDTQAHLELDGNEIMAKGSGTTTATLNLNIDGGNVVIGKSGLTVKPNKTYNSLITGSGTAGSTSGTTYKPSLWTFNTGNAFADGDIICIKIPVAGHANGVYLSVDSGVTYKPCIISGTSLLTTHYGNGVFLMMMYEANVTVSAYPSGGGSEKSNVTGVWRVVNYRDTTYSAMSTSELTTGTATTSRTVRADYLKAGIEAVAPNNKVTQTTTWEDVDYYLTLAHSANNAEETDTIYKTNRLTFNPANGNLKTSDGTYNTTVGAGNITFHTGGGISSYNAQNMSLKASTEQAYWLILGVVNMGGSNIYWRFAPNNNTGAIRLGDSSNRWGQIYSTNSTISTSDRNEKKDIVELDENAKDFIMTLNPVSYKLKDGNTGRTHYGMIAQDVEEELKDLGMTPMDFAGFCKDQKTESYEVEVVDKNGETHTEQRSRDVEGEYVYGLRYEEFIAPLIKTVQMQQKEIDELKAQVKLLLGGKG